MLCQCCSIAVAAARMLGRSTHNVVLTTLAAAAVWTLLQLGAAATEGDARGLLMATSDAPGAASAAEPDYLLQEGRKVE